MARSLSSSTARSKQTLSLWTSFFGGLATQSNLKVQPLPRVKIGPLSTPIVSGLSLSLFTFIQSSPSPGHSLEGLQPNPTSRFNHFLESKLGPFCKISNTSYFSSFWWHLIIYSPPPPPLSCQSLFLATWAAARCAPNTNLAHLRWLTEICFFFTPKFLLHSCYHTTHLITFPCSLFCWEGNILIVGVFMIKGAVTRKKKQEPLLYNAPWGQIL